MQVSADKHKKPFKKKHFFIKIKKSDIDNNFTSAYNENEVVKKLTKEI